VEKNKSQLKIELPYQKELQKWLQLADLVCTLLSPLLGEGGPKRAPNGIFGDFNNNFGGFPRFKRQK